MSVVKESARDIIMGFFCCCCCVFKSHMSGQKSSLCVLLTSKYLRFGLDSVLLCLSLMYVAG